MKREICCMGCSNRKIKEYPGESHKKDIGHSKFDMNCDLCGKDIQKGEKASAFSFFLINQYSPWVSVFLDIESYNKEVKIKDMLKF